MVTIQEEEPETRTIGKGREQGDGWETASEGDPSAPPDDSFEDALTEEQQRQRIITQAEASKASGNTAYSLGNYRDALEAYQAALELLDDNPDMSGVRSMCLCNRAMCYLQLKEFEESVHESSKAIELSPSYVKAYFRRGEAHEKVDHVEEALADMKKVVELEPGNKDARKAVERLEPIVEERREKMKEEVIGKAKEVGNKLLGMFGMSIDNFKAVKDPNTAQQQQDETSQAEETITLPNRKKL